MNPLTQSIVSGAMSGAVYALLAIGLVLAYQTSRVVNLAHGESFAVGGLVAAGLADAGLPLWVYLPAALLAAVLFLLAVERFLLRPRSAWPTGSLILLTLAAAFLTRGALQLVMGVDPLSFPRTFAGRPIFVAGGVLTPQGLALIVIGIAATVAVMLFLRLSPLGHRLRAVAENPDAAELLGVDVDRSRALAFGIAGALGGLGALLLVPLVSVDYQAGLGMTLRGFIAAALAGMEPSRAIVAGFGLGLAEALVTNYAGALAQDPIVFLALIAVAAWQSRKVMFGGAGRA
jgi:branched-subunit amino acid ABC-type transport system permease component